MHSKANLCFRCFGDGRFIDIGGVRVVLQPLLLWSFSSAFILSGPETDPGFWDSYFHGRPLPSCFMFYLFFFFQLFPFGFSCYPSFDPYCSHSSSSFFALFHYFLPSVVHMCSPLFSLCFIRSLFPSFVTWRVSHCCTVLLVVYNPVHVRTHANLPTHSRRFKLCHERNSPHTIWSLDEPHRNQKRAKVACHGAASTVSEAGRRNTHAHRDRLDGPAR